MKFISTGIELSHQDATLVGLKMAGCVPWQEAVDLYMVFRTALEQEVNCEVTYLEKMAKQDGLAEALTDDTLGTFDTARIARKVLQLEGAVLKYLEL